MEAGWGQPKSVLYEERDTIKDGANYGNPKQKHRLRFYGKKNSLGLVYLVAFPESVESSRTSQIAMIKTGCVIFAHILSQVIQDISFWNAVERKNIVTGN